MTDLAKLLLMLYNIEAANPAGSQLDTIQAQLQQLLKGQADMSDTLTELQTALTALDSKIDQAVVVMSDAASALKAGGTKVTAANGDTATLRAIAADLAAHGNKLNAAIGSLQGATDGVKAVPLPPEPVPQPDPVPGTDAPPPAKTI